MWQLVPNELPHLLGDLGKLGQTKHPKPSGCFGGSPFKKREATGRCLTFCLSVCPVQFVSVQLKSGSELVLGVRSEPKTRLSLSVTLCVHCSVQFVFTELQSGSNFLLGGYIRNRNITSNFWTDSQYNLEKSGPQGPQRRNRSALFQC